MIREGGIWEMPSSILPPNVAFCASILSGIDLGVPHGEMHLSRLSWGKHRLEILLSHFQVHSNLWKGWLWQKVLSNVQKVALTLLLLLLSHLCPLLNTTSEMHGYGSRVTFQNPQWPVWCDFQNGQWHVSPQSTTSTWIFHPSSFCVKQPPQVFLFYFICFIDNLFLEVLCMHPLVPMAAHHNHLHMYACVSMYVHFLFFYFICHDPVAASMIWSPPWPPGWPTINTSCTMMAMATVCPCNCDGDSDNEMCMANATMTRHWQQQQWVHVRMTKVTMRHAA